MNSDSGTYRAVRDTFWTDIMILDLEPDEKLFYIWLFTNPHLDTCGCYQVSIRTIEYETALSRDRIMDLIRLFVGNGRIKYDETNKEILLLKWRQNNSGFFNPKNANSLKAIKLGAAKIKTPEFKQIVDDWLGAVAPAEEEAPQAPTLPPSEAPTLGGRTQPKPEPEPEPEPKPTATTARATVTRQFEECFQEHEQKLRQLFPHADYAAERELCVAHYRDGPVHLDPWVVVLKWFNRIKKPDGGGNGNGTGRGRAGRSGAVVGKAPGVTPANGPEADWLGGSQFAPAHCPALPD